MWPDGKDIGQETLDAEAALEGIYAEALRRWLPELEKFVLPDLDGQVVNGDPALIASTLPPNPGAANSASQVWDQLNMELILVGLKMIWGLTFVRAVNGLGKTPVPASRGESSSWDKSLLSVMKTTLGASAADVATAMTAVETYTAAKAAVTAFADKYVSLAASIPGIIADRLTRVVDKADPAMPTAELRASIREIIVPSSPEMRDLARQQGYQAAGVMNDATLAGAIEVSESADPFAEEELQKVWLATLDSKTRDTHWAAWGQRVPKDGKFTVGAAELEYPGDPDGPPEEVKNCRCRVGVLAKDEKLPDEIDLHTERLGGRDATARHREGSQADERERRAERGVVRAQDDPDGIGHVAASAAVLETNPEEDTAVDTYRTFTDAVVAIIGSPTSDGRMLAADIDLSFRSFPLPLMWTKQSSMGHLEAYTVGVIESASVADGKVLASGYLLNSAEADDAAEQIGHGVTGPSVDLAATEWMLTDENGKEISEEDWWDMPMDAVVLQTITAAELIGTTLVSTPAFGDTSITLNGERESRDIAVVASAAEEFRPRTYDHRLFENPQLTGPTLPTMGDDGRIYGHLACFGECHRSIQSQCVMAPRSRSNYSHFHTSPALRMDDGRRLPVGRLTVGTGHAPDNLRPGPAIDHYDNTGTCFALVRVGEDEHGIWFSGVAAPGATAEQIEMGLSAPLSGDWRDFGEGLELIAALAVNTPGFAARGREDDQGRPIALVASLGPAPDTKREGIEHLTATAISEAVAEGIALAEQRRAEAELAASMRAQREELIARAAALVGPPPTPREQITELLERSRA